MPGPKPLLTYKGQTEEQLLHRIESGENLTVIAASIKGDRPSMVRWLMNDPEKSARFQAARISASGAWIDLAEKKISEAKDPFKLSVAKELAHQYRWHASKIAPKIYGDRTTVVGDPDAPIAFTSITIAPIASK